MTQPCHSPYCECEAGKCTHPGFHDARHVSMKSASPSLDFDSDEPLPVCPMRNNGDDICESCQ